MSKCDKCPAAYNICELRDIDDACKVFWQKNNELIAKKIKLAVKKSKKEK